MRRNHTRNYKRNKSKIIDMFDRDVIFRADLPDILYIVDYQRKTIFTNMEADVGACGVKQIGREYYGA